MAVKLKKIEENLLDKNVEEELREHYSSLDKLCFVAMLLALNIALPKEFEGSEFDTPNALNEIIPYIMELEQIIKAPSSPMNYLGYDLKSFGATIVMGLMRPKLKDWIATNMLQVFERGKSNPDIRLYCLNWDRCLILKYVSGDIGRESLPKFSDILKSVAKGEKDYSNQPYLAIHTLVNLQESKFEDMGPNFRSQLYTEEEAMKTKLQEAANAVKSTEDSFESTIQDANAGLDEMVTTINDMVNDPKALSEIVDLALKLDGVGGKKMTDAEREQALAIKDLLKNKVSDEVTTKSDNKSGEWTTTEKVLAGLAGAAALGGIGYGLYRYLRRDDAVSAFAGAGIPDWAF